MIIEYPISSNYMKHWSLKHAIREVVQNALDSDQYFIESNYECIAVSNKVVGELNKKELLWLGESNKRPGAIGKYGEGLKLALLVLAREKIPHSFDTPIGRLYGIIKNDQFCICFDEEKTTTIATFYIHHSEAEDLANDMLLSTRKYKLLGENATGQCIDLAGCVYVNGLLVTDKAGTKYGYNFKPSKINLDRDRQTVSDFDLTWETSQLLHETFAHSDLAELMYENVKDVQYVQNFASNSLKKACLDYAIKIYGEGVLIARTAEEARVWQVLNPKARVIHRSGGFGILASSSIGERGLRSSSPSENPSEVMLSFFERNKKHVRSKALTELKAIVQASTKWTKK